ncbi:GMC family oxidoreductase [Paracoccus denitrificans]|jgi:choline dehydrogenase-like flavoprotein|uniref:Glucose-methanol-choline oxidoreductase n=1 Tax=Paracoccus denitrificans (strain Pd 1222) TaxID=318586 RepID=A1B112_PARDP|nr:GMC family oxidoreductase N-terminal domain-containing protein [Paracoccus denitrificans]ABL69206.1 glucose-methanol-choline oxidoreductase [Paracoccus denitrificans PD1222]MBB4629036.1 choline dehydrogenase-like flavoprotein [Paracoccus denitrificans]MCU7430017.1 GMC family oxidoreductase N-terminal domain-containing protein [Paracoccus denitrificans]QAR27219.1 FAD-binding protein [Paracoccus denitrificans]UPV96188.1 GMC family oxidoreductase N-terminal domain-containing protein [Paracoccu
MDWADYVIVGGGSTGCVMASRLSEDADTQVVLLEGGPRDRNPYIHIPGAYYKTAQGPLLKRFPWEPTDGQNRTEQPTMVQASVLGGGSSVNAMIYVRGNPDDYATWENLGASGWGYQDVLPYFRKAENNNRFCNEAHGIDGPLGVSDIDHIHPLTRAWLQACQQKGLPLNPDFNSGDQAGCGLYQITARNGRRSSAAVAYLKPARKRRNLSVRTGARVLRVLVENGRATGVEYVAKGRTRTIRARREVILSAGGINTPKLLMLSGIGPADELRRHGIEVVHDLPGVGQNLQDHIEISLIYQLNGPHSYDKYKKLHWKALAGLNYLLFKGGPASSNLIEGGAFWWADRAEKRPDVQYFMVVGAGVEEGVEAVPGGNGCTINLGQIRPRSRGEVRLTSADPAAFPRVIPNYFSDPHDLETITDGAMFALEVMEQSAISRYVERRQLPEAGPVTRDQIRRFCQTTAHAALHPAGTCRAGVDDMAVVDPQLRVHGIEGLRVADASIMPTLISGNPNAVCIMIGEKLSDMMRRS